jgi:hypothetical protein
MTIALFRDWPRLPLRLKEPVLIPEERANQYPLLKADLIAIDTMVRPAFREYDLAARRAQNSFRGQQVALICVTALTTAFGAVQAAFRHDLWPGIVVAVLGVLAAAIAGLGQERGTQRDYLDQRTRAERLRAAAFAYLGELSPYDNQDRKARLIAAVADVAQGREPAVSSPEGAPQGGGREARPEYSQAEAYKDERAKEFAALYAEDRIQDQLGFYHDRRTAAERARDQAINAKWALSTLAAIAGSVGAAVSDWRVGLAIAAAFLAAAATAVATYQSLYGYPRLAKIYHDAERSLSALNAAGAGFNADLPPEEIRAVADRVESIFRQENGQWGQLMQHSGETGSHSGAQ